MGIFKHLPFYLNYIYHLWADLNQNGKIFAFLDVKKVAFFRGLIPRVGMFSACSHLVVDMKNTEATSHFLDEFIGFLPISGYYYFFLEKPEEASSQQSETLFNHPFFQKVLSIIDALP